VLVNRDGYRDLPDSVMIEGEDFVEVDGVRINKPFVEKPVDAEDHNIHIYYPMNAGGGRKRLFRKIGNRSSEFDPHINTVRQKGSFIYEEFLSTQGTDVKVYTVGPNYAHAEARKSPVLDGKVLRDADGKEVRYPVILSTKEKEIAHQVCRAFGQTICGFDILRVHDESYVCDVNGWSFVKNSVKYYEDCSILLAKYLERALAGSQDPFNTRMSEGDHPSEISTSGAHQLLDTAALEQPIAEENLGNQQEELRCVLAVIRHGDRTPKQKMKMNVCHPFFLEFYEQKVSEQVKDHDSFRKPSDLKIKAVKDLQMLLDVSKKLIHLFEMKDSDFLAFLTKRQQIYGEDSCDRMKGYCTLRDVLQRWQLCGINRKVQLKPKEYIDVEDDNGVLRRKVTKLLLILKWGGDLTHFGMDQAERLGQRFRQIMYPGGKEGGLIRLHSTYRHDLKIYTSDEGRVQKTAASFAKGLLELEGDIIPILVSLVLKSKDADSMLDQSGSSAQEAIMKVKQKLHKIIHRGDSCQHLMEQSDSQLIRSVAAALAVVEQPIKKMERMHKLLFNLKEQITKMLHEKTQSNSENIIAPSTAKSPLLSSTPDISSIAEEEFSSETTTAVAVNMSLDTLTSPKAIEERAQSFNSSPALLQRSRSSSHSRHEPLGRTGTFNLDSPTNRPKRSASHSDRTGMLLHPEPCGRETLEMMRERWSKLHKDFYSKKSETYDLSKIPDIHDCIRYDAIHNSHLRLEGVKELLDIASSLAHALVPQEYGINVDEKIHIGAALCRTLLMKMKDDLDLARGLKVTHRLNPSYAKDKHEIKSTHRSVRTRLYFTSESHLHTLLNVLRYTLGDAEVLRQEAKINTNGLHATSPISVSWENMKNLQSPLGDDAKKWIEEAPELCYMTHFVIRVFERFQYPPNDPLRYRCEIMFSPGADGDPLQEFSRDKPLDVAPLHVVSREDLTCQEFVDYLANAIEFAETNELRVGNHESASSGSESEGKDPQQIHHRSSIANHSEEIIHK
jgi:inositol hexakisphosphate/diphosphoinositol-pentakisphosphate kinase